MQATAKRFAIKQLKINIINDCLNAVFILKIKKLLKIGFSSKNVLTVSVHAAMFSAYSNKKISRSYPCKLMDYHKT